MTRFLAVAGAIALFSVLGVSSVSGAPPTDVVIHLHPCVFAPTEVGIWDASGAINDSGSYVRTDLETSPPDRPIGTPGPVHETFALKGAVGGFKVDTNTDVRDGAQPGVWSIHGGTEVYADTSGHGDFAFSFAPVPSCFGGVTFTVTLTGVAGKVGAAI